MKNKKIRCLRGGILAYSVIITIALIITYATSQMEIKELKEPKATQAAEIETTPRTTPQETPVHTANPAEIENAVQYTETFTVTAYCACYDCCGKNENNPHYGVTATGTKATAGRTVAVDPTVIPYGSTVIIDGHSYIAEDTGGAVKGKRIDIYFDNHDEALKFGRRELEVTIC